MEELPKSSSSHEYKALADELVDVSQNNNPLCSTVLHAGASEPIKHRGSSEDVAVRKERNTSEDRWVSTQVIYFGWNP